MAKKKTAEVIEEPLVEETVMVEETPEEGYVEPKPKRVEKKNRVLNDGWELKDRIYRLKNGKKPLSRYIK